MKKHTTNRRGHTQQPQIPHHRGSETDRPLPPRKVERTRLPPRDNRRRHTHKRADSRRLRHIRRADIQTPVQNAVPHRRILRNNKQRTRRRLRPRPRRPLPEKHRGLHQNQREHRRRGRRRRDGQREFRLERTGQRGGKNVVSGDNRCSILSLRHGTKHGKRPAANTSAPYADEGKGCV